MKMQAFRYLVAPTVFLLMSCFVTPVFAAASYQELWATTLFTTANGYTAESVQTAFAPFVSLTLAEAQAILDAENAGNAAGALSTLNTAVAAAAAATVTAAPVVSAIAGAGGGASGAVYVAPAGATARFVFSDLVAPSPAPIIQVKMAEADTAAKKSRSFGASGRMQLMESDVVDSEYDADVYGLNLGMAYDFDNRTVGMIYGYEYIDFESGLASVNGKSADSVVHRNTLVGYLQQHIPLAENIEATLTGHVNYIYAFINYDDYGKRSVNTGGAGASGALTYDNQRFIATLGLSYSFNHDDSNAEDDDLELFKTGTVFGLRQGENTVYDVSFVYDRNLSGADDNDSFEVGAKMQHYLTDTWNLTVGYKKVLGLKDFDSDEYILGSSWNF